MMNTTAKKSAIIVDIDGTVANIEHRMKYWEKKPRDYVKFYENIEDDKPIEEIIWLARSICIAHLPEVDIIYLTGRHEGVRKRTEIWLRKHGLPKGPLYMRGDTDFSPDTEWKKTCYYGRIAPHYDVKFVLEDRQSVVAMWRSIGLRCIQVAEGNY